MRIFPPLFLAIVVAWVLLKISVFYGTDLPGVHAVGASGWIASLFLLDGWFVGPERALNVTWTLVIEISFYLLVALFIKKAKTKPLQSQWQMTLVWSAASLSALNLPVISSMGNAGLIKYIAFLLIGRVIYLRNQRVITTFDFLLNSVFLAYIFWAFTQVSTPDYLLTPGFEPIVSYLLAICIFLGALRIAPHHISLPFRFFGDISYSLYLLHLPVGMFALNWLNAMSFPNSLSSLIAIALCIPVAYLSYKYVELPCLKLGRRIIASKHRLPKLRISFNTTY